MVSCTRNKEIRISVAIPKAEENYIIFNFSQVYSDITSNSKSEREMFSDVC